MRELGKDPLTWSFVKLFGHHIFCDLHEFEALPASHAWHWKEAGLWRARLLTKAQCSGVVVSVVERSDRVEFLVDDGTALVKAVLWGEGVQSEVALGDLVHVEGKLNVDKNWDAPEMSRELRVLRIAKVEDPNEELLHWTQVMELAETYYSTAAGEPLGASTKPNGAAGGAHWEDIAAQAFFSLCISPGSKQQFLERSRRSPHDEALLNTLEAFLSRQKASDAEEPIGITFSDHIAATECAVIAKGEDETTSKSQRIRALQFAFRKLRRAGLLFLEDDAADRHVLLSFEASLKPALLQLLQGNRCSKKATTVRAARATASAKVTTTPQGCSVAEIADALLSQERFKCIPLHWIELSLKHLVASQLVVQREESQRFSIK